MTLALSRCRKARPRPSLDPHHRGRSLPVVAAEGCRHLIETTARLGAPHARHRTRVLRSRALVLGSARADAEIPASAAQRDGRRHNLTSRRSMTVCARVGDGNTASGHSSTATPYHRSMNLELSDEEAAAHTKKLANITGYNRSRGSRGDLLIR
jgi:hypothetical protein